MIRGAAEQSAMSGRERQVVDLLGEPSGIEDVDFEVPISREDAIPASFDDATSLLAAARLPVLSDQSDPEDEQ
jgi:hypothetical protein